MRTPSKERGCKGKTNLGRDYVRHADRFSRMHGKRYGVYRCPHCGGTPKIDKQTEYPPFLYVT